jgi:hypothetical protein
MNSSADTHESVWSLEVAVRFETSIWNATHMFDACIARLLPRLQKPCTDRKSRRTC